MINNLLGSLFGKIIEKYIDINNYRKDLKKARIGWHAKNALSMAFFITLCLLLFGMVLSTYFFSELLLVLGFFVSGIVSVLLFVFIYYYPKLVIQFRRRKINMEMGEAITFMYALSRGGINLPNIFRRLSRHRKVYGEVAEEINLIVTEMDYFSNDVFGAINECIKYTPSKKMKDFLSGLLPIMKAGGDETTYFKQSLDKYFEEVLDEQESYISFLGYLSEVYVTGFVAGPLMAILGIVLISITFGAVAEEIYYLIYVLIPLSGFIFILFLRLVSPEDSKKYEEVDEEITKYGATSKNKSEEANNSNIKIKPKFMQRLYGIYYNFLFNPWKVLVVSVPAFFVFLGWQYTEMGISYLFLNLEMYAVLSTLIIFLPVSIFYEVKDRRRRKIKEQFPDFLRITSSLNRAGMSLKNTVEEVSEVPGIVGKYAKQMKESIKWNIDVRVAFKKFANKLKDRDALKSIILILEGNRAHSNISTVLNVAVENASNREKLHQMKKMEVTPYILLVWISFGVFIFVAVVLSTMFLAEIPLPEGELGLNGPEFGFEEGDIKVLEEVIVHITMILGFISGLIAGELSKSSLYSGLKHSISMLTLAYLIFYFFL